MLPIARWSASTLNTRRFAPKRLGALRASTLRACALRAGALRACALRACALRACALSVGAVAATAFAAGTASAAGTGTHPAYSARVILSGAGLRHMFVRAGSATRHSAPLTLPDDITAAGPYLFTAFQNGVGPQGQAAPDGNRDSTVVEFTRRGRVLRQWDIRGKCDGLTADPARHRVIATVNEDAHSSMYTIAPWAAPAGQVRH